MVGAEVTSEPGTPAFAQTLSQSAQLDLPPGSYLVTGLTAYEPDPIVGKAYLPTVTGSPATVTAGQTASVTVSYGAALPGSGELWVPDYNDGTMLAIPSAQLANASPVPDWVLSADAGGGEYSQAVVADAQGRIWATTYDYLFGWTLYDDGGASDPAIFSFFPDDSGNSGSFQLYAEAFDTYGNLWIGDESDGVLLKISPDQLASGGGQLVPAQIIQNTLDDGGLDSLSSPYSFAFDSAGNLWVPNLGGLGGGTVSELPALSDGGISDTASTVLYSSTGFFSEPVAVAFDANGKMWIGDYNDNQVLRLDPSGLSGDVDVGTAEAVIAQAAIDGGNGASSLDGIDSIAFDQSGNLWVYTQNDGALERFSAPSGLVGTVSPQPDIYLVGGWSGDTGHIQFDPPPRGLGLYP